MTRRSLTRSLAIAACALAAACTSTESTLSPSALIAPGAGQQAGRVAAVNNNVRLQFDPVVGATLEATQPLSARLQQLAGETGIAIAASTNEANILLKGYFSAISEDGATTVIYVWDVVDPDGNRLHRIQGQQPATSGVGEGWTAVSDANMQAIADETMSQLVVWLATRPS